MEYLFGRYFQLPTIFKLFAPQLQVCHAYYTTALIYNYNTSRPCVFFNTTPPAGKSYSFAALFIKQFQETGFTFVPPRDGGPQDPLAYVTLRLQQHTAAIREIGENVTAPFLNYTSVDEWSSVGSSTSPSTSPSPSESQLHRTPSAQSRAQKAQKALKEFDTQDLLGYSLPSSDSDDSSYKFSQDLSQDSSPGSSPGSSQGDRERSRSPKRLTKNLSDIDYGGGGSLMINKSNKRCKTKRKNRKTTRKNGKVTRMFKKRKTYRRKVNGRKLKGNNHKNNKTMRRYRRVRK